MAEAAYPLRLSEVVAERGRHPSPLSVPSWPLTFTVGFRSVHIPSVIQDQFCV